MRKGDPLCLALADRICGRGGRLLRDRIVVDLFFGFQNLAGRGVDFIVIRKTSRFKVNIIDHDAVLRIQLGFAGQNRRRIDTGMRKGDFFGFFRADIGFFAGGADGLDPRFRRRRTLPQQVQFVDGEGRKLPEGVPPVIVQNLTDQLRFPDGNAVGFCQLPQRIVFGNGLAQHGTAERVGLQQAIDFIGESRLHLCAARGIAVVNADENRVCKLGQITVLQHGADDRVDGHLKVAAAKVHIADDNLTVCVQRRNLQHPLFPIDCDFHARIDIQRNRGIHGIVDLIPQIAEDAACHDAQTCGQRGEARKSAICLFCRCHTYTSFRFRAVGKHGGQNIRRGVRVGAPQFFVDFMLCHE